jgi:hypothetical protein
VLCLLNKALKNSEVVEVLFRVPLHGKTKRVVRYFHRLHQTIKPAGCDNKPWCHLVYALVMIDVAAHMGKKSSQTLAFSDSQLPKWLDEEEEPEE